MSLTPLKDRLIIGTVKLGVEYGAIELSKVSEQTALSILKYCYDQDIQIFDTAPSYGTAEDLLGLTKRTIEHNSDEIVITKLAKLQSDISDKELARLKSVFEESLSKLSTDSVYGLLVHDVADLQQPNSERIYQLMSALKSAGLVQKIGVSVYSEEEAFSLFEQYDFDLIQVPCNLFDQRFIRSGCLEWLKQRNIEVHARSLFLKGVLLKPQINTSLPESLRIQHEKLTDYLYSKQISHYDYCLNFASSIAQVDKWVVGVSSIEQVDALLNANYLDSSGMDFIQWEVVDELAVDPRYW